MAGFEPAWWFPTSALQAAAFGHLATSTSRTVRMSGIEPPSQVYRTFALPLSYTRINRPRPILGGGRRTKLTKLSKNRGLSP